MRMKNYLGDFFLQNDRPETVELRDGIRHFIVISCDAEVQKLWITQYELECKPEDVIDTNKDIVSPLLPHQAIRNPSPKRLAPSWN